MLLLLLLLLSQPPPPRLSLAAAAAAPAYLCLLLAYDGSHRHLDEEVIPIRTITLGALTCRTTQHHTITCLEPLR
jgi:hypothetical protein